MSAEILYHPTHDRSPVVQPRRRGRYPKAVGRLREAMLRRVSQEIQRRDLLSTIQKMEGWRENLQRDLDALNAEIRRRRLRLREHDAQDEARRQRQQG